MQPSEPGTHSIIPTQRDTERNTTVEFSDFSPENRANYPRMPLHRLLTYAPFAKFTQVKPAKYQA
ncbi:hypothetical protein KIK06_28630 [Nocardiopsis sp. EMB25]|uniref:hypothetical protein n=1 Tax=Nocardiopsis sp. EMB25 TaxID=2835867 RepID=UPI0022840F43|nr:hypothetical protein [Nocardiopsis sp. EMB25]MCY9787849.1 hypothetical protein [Nocardiopsis sp. EMB25]